MKRSCLVGFSSGMSKLTVASAGYYFQDWIRKNSRKKVAHAGEIIHTVSENTFFLLEEGMGRLWVDDRKTLEVLVPGGMLWLDETPPNYGGATSSCELMTKVVYYEMPMRQIRESVDRDKLLAAVLEFASLNAMAITKMWLDQCVSDSYGKIKLALERMSTFPESLRRRLSAISFVVDTSGISRSHALAILKALKEGGYIDIDSGHLVRIAKKMPVSY